MRAIHICFYLGFTAIALSDTLGGFCFRATIAAPLMWTGIISLETAQDIAVLYPNRKTNY